MSNFALRDGVGHVADDVRGPRPQGRDGRRRHRQPHAAGDARRREYEAGRAHGGGHRRRCRAAPACLNQTGCRILDFERLMKAKAKRISTFLSR